MRRFYQKYLPKRKPLMGTSSTSHLLPLQFQDITPLKTNTSPKREPFQKKKSSLPTTIFIYFSVGMLVLGTRSMAQKKSNKSPQKSHLQVEDDHCSPAENSQRHWVTCSAAPDFQSHQATTAQGSHRKGSHSQPSFLGN